MAMHGSLKDMSVADIIQHNCQDQKTALLVVDNGSKKAQLYFRGGAVIHASMDELQGEEVVYQALAWQDGKFILEMGTPSPAMTIQRSWSSLLLEGAKRFDEFHQDDVLGLVETAASKDEVINSRIATFLAGSAIFKGVAIADINGAVLVVRSEEALEKDMVGAVVSAMVSFGKRSLSVMSQGKLLYMVIQGDTGCLVVAFINPTTLFFGLAPNRPDLQKAMEEINHLRTNIFEYV